MKFLNQDKTKKDSRYSEGQRIFFFSLITVIFVIFVVAFCLPGSGENVGGDKGLPGGFSDRFPKAVVETDDVTFGIDVAKYQGTIDWGIVGDSGIDFAIVRVGYRTQSSGQIEEDTNARYNMQEATANGLKIGAYFFSTAVSEAEAVEENRIEPNCVNKGSYDSVVYCFTFSNIFDSWSDSLRLLANVSLQSPVSHLNRQWYEPPAKCGRGCGRSAPCVQRPPS